MRNSPQSRQPKSQTTERASRRAKQQSAPAEEPINRARQPKSQSTERASRRTKQQSAPAEEPINKAMRRQPKSQSTERVSRRANQQSAQSATWISVGSWTLAKIETIGLMWKLRSFESTASSPVTSNPEVFHARGVARNSAPNAA